MCQTLEHVAALVPEFESVWVVRKFKSEEWLIEVTPLKQKSNINTLFMIVLSYPLFAIMALITIYDEEVPWKENVLLISICNFSVLPIKSWCIEKLSDYVTLW